MTPHARQADSEGQGVAIVGLACTFPGARNLHEFWRNIANGIDAITDAPPERWDIDAHYDPNREGAVYCKRGGYLGTSFTFNPLKCGTMPRAIEGAEPEQFLVLRAVYEALEDAGYLGERKLATDRTAVILGRGNYLGSGVTGLVQRGMITEQTLQILRALHPEFTPEDLDAIRREMHASLPGFGPDTAPGLIPNIVTGRAANRLDLMGPTFTVDAACASSLIATDIAVRGLLSNQFDAVLAGGVHLFSDVSFLQVFCAMGALSRSSTIRPYDADCDGTITGEGVGILMLKRLADAERDGDRIYAVIKGIGTSSDGKAMGVTAPRVEGEILAIRRAYEMSGISPETIGLIEGHGTATSVGDPAEIEALRSFFGPRAEEHPSIALGSIKSMIGHAMPAAGAASLIKTALALYHRQLPPSINCCTPDEQLAANDSRFYVNTVARPWLNASEHPRRAGVNAFGFGGVNAHVVLEEYVSPAAPRKSGAQTPITVQATSLIREWETELLIINAESREELNATLDRLHDYCLAVPSISLRDLAHTINTKGIADHRLAIVAHSLADLADKLARASKRLADPNCKQIKDAKGIYYLHDSSARGHKIAFVFPGLGAQHVNLMADLCMYFPEVRETFERADRAIGRRLSADIYPPPTFTEDQKAKLEARLAQIERANPAVLTANGAMYKLLDSLGVRADMMTGHSSGEWVVMPTSGMVTIDEFVSGMSKLGDMWRRLREDESVPHRVMLAVGADRETVKKLAEEIRTPIEIANDNCRHQVLIVVHPESTDLVMSCLRSQGVFVERLPYTHGYHTHEFTFVTDALRDYFGAMSIKTPNTTLYSCTTAKPYPNKPQDIVELLASTFARPLLFRDTIEAMYADGARVFVEVGPRGNLTAFIDDILRGRPHAAIATNQHRKSGITALNHALAQLAALHVPVKLDHLYQNRAPRKLTLDAEQDRPINETDQPGAVQISLCPPRMKMKPRDVAPRTDASKPSSATERIPTQPPATVPNVLQEHFRLMEEFLQTNEAVMQAYLTGRGEAAPHNAIPESQPGALQTEHDEAVVTAQPQQSPKTETSEQPQEIPVRSLETILLAIVGERTGYPPDMLDLDLDMEADLGIDSIKRIEILGALQQAGGDAETDEAIDMEEVARLKTLRQVLVFLSTSINEQERAADETESRYAGSRRGSSDHLGTDYPFAVTVLNQTPDEILVEREINVEEDLYLHDHCFDPYISNDDPTRERLCIVPLTVSLEMMLEVAARLRPDFRVIAARNVHAAKWIEVEPGGSRVTIEIHAKRIAENEIHATLLRRTEDGGSASVAEATCVLAESFPTAPGAVEPELTNSRSAANSAEQMYEERRMFHGPRFRGVASLDIVGENGLLALLEILPTNNVLRSTQDPNFIVDPFLLDAAGQLVGYWPVEYLSEGFVLFPIRIQELTLYQPNPHPGSRSQCRLRITDVSKRQLRADMDILAPDGSLWMRITGWEDWRFYWDENFYDFWRYPDQNMVSERLTLPGINGDVECRKMAPFGEMGSSIWENLWAHLILGRNELAQYRAMNDGPRRSEWIFGRAAAKDAVRVWLKRNAGIEPYPADVEIVQDENGKPSVTGKWRDAVADVPHLSIAHKGNFAVAVVSRSPIGIDLEPIQAHEESFERLTFTDAEREYSNRLPASSDRAEWITRAWCAKEAAAKAFGTGFAAGPRSFTVRPRDGHGADFIVTRTDDPHGVEFEVTTIRTDDFIIAVALTERSTRAAV